MPLDRNDPEVIALMKEVADSTAATVAADFSGLKTKNEELIGEVRKAKETMKQFEGIDIKAFKELQTKMANDEEFKLIQEGKVDEVINRRFDRMRVEYDGKLTAAEEAVQKLANERDSFKNRYERENISSALRKAAEKAGVVPEAIDDVILRGQGLFSIDEDGSVVSLDKSGKIATDSKGKPITTESFVDALRDKAPHYWRQSQSADFSGNNNNMDSLETKLLEASKSGDMATYNKVKAEIAKRKSA